ncbi:hypothetical protein MUN82_10595 [Hymenobacter aerilatus]|uniref:Uncharacterized protein n=1 Tax=Hymenobacter aerilatus TaxID=2932251 RepID=A0A8T9T3I1_9BACT|nr:hypothetical protein [Hymenobacter aerilatus]UOR07523.1 hypothetical protein MUN82_10595 [Hymenobacter aerilatus]
MPEVASYSALPGPAMRLFAPQMLLRWSGVLLLVLFLFGLTWYTEEFYATLTPVWERLLASAGIGSAVQHDDAAQHLMNRSRSVPVAGLYAVLYLAACLALVRLLLVSAQQWRMAVLFYAVAGGSGILLLLVGKLLALPAAYALSSQIIHFILSPLAVITLVPVLRWYAPVVSKETV